MTGKDDKIYLLHILEAIEQIEEYIADCDLAHFLVTLHFLNKLEVTRFHQIADAKSTGS